MKLQPGDVFFQTSGTWLDSIINFFQSLWSGDRRSVFSHCGIVIDEDGTTFETSTWRTGFYNINSRRGRKTVVYVVRHMFMRRLKIAFPNLSGRIYPYWRLPLFALGLAKYIHRRNMVCSEIVADFLYNVGIRRSYWGVSVDDLVDQIQSDPAWGEVYFEFGWGKE
jgi:hypothetical protein